MRSMVTPEEPAAGNLRGSDDVARYRWRTAVRKRLPWFLIDFGIAPVTSLLVV